MRRLPPRRLSDMATIAPILGLILLTPPVIGLFATEGTIFGAPVILIYLFAVWFGLIALAAILSRQLARFDKSEPE